MSSVTIKSVTVKLHFNVKNDIVKRKHYSILEKRKGI